MKEAWRKSKYDKKKEEVAHWWPCCHKCCLWKEKKKNRCPVKIKARVKTPHRTVAHHEQSCKNKDVVFFFLQNELYEKAKNEILDEVISLSQVTPQHW